VDEKLQPKPKCRELEHFVCTTASPLERGVNRHGVAVSQTEFPLQPGNNSTSFNTRLQQALFLGELLKLFRRLACLGFDVVYVSLE
jgi:hypothetical protein